jgi:hypothetical protein
MVLKIKILRYFDFKFIIIAPSYGKYLGNYFLVD